MRCDANRLATTGFWSQFCIRHLSLLRCSRHTLLSRPVSGCIHGADGSKRHWHVGRACRSCSSEKVGAAGAGGAYCFPLSSSEMLPYRICTTFFAGHHNRRSCLIIARNPGPAASCPRSIIMSARKLAHFWCHLTKRRVQLGPLQGHERAPQFSTLCLLRSPLRDSHRSSLSHGVALPPPGPLLPG